MCSISEPMQESMNVQSVESQSSYRVEDVFLISLKKIEGATCTKATIFSGFYSGIGLSVLEEDLPDETISPRLWKKLIDIDAKLNLILEKLIRSSDGFNQAQNRQVFICEEDIRIITPDEFSTGDIIEMKLLLPVTSPVWLVLYGKVSRHTRNITPDQNEIEIRFFEMPDDVKQVLGYYLMNRQREIIRKIRQRVVSSINRYES